jgi:hypothetical protein
MRALASLARCAADASIRVEYQAGDLGAGDGELVEVDLPADVGGGSGE